MKSFIFPAVFALSFSLFADVPDSADAVSPVEIGQAAPNPTVQTLDGKSVTLKAVTDGTPTVLVFYRGGWCPYCTRQLAALQEVLPEIQEAGWKLVAVSPDQPSKLSETVKDKSLSYQLVSDSSMEAAKAFGLAFQVDAPTVNMLDGYGIDLIAASGRDHQQLPVPAVLLIDADNTVTFLHQDANYKKRLNPKDLLKALTADS